MKSTLIAFFLFHISVQVFSQADFREGYIITIGEDTIFGKIDFRAAGKMGEICRFKRSGAHKVEAFTPDQLIAFRFYQGGYFLVKNYEENKYFFECLFLGKVNLYFLESESGANYYMDKAGVELALLAFEEGFKQVDGKNHFYQTTKHQRVLFSFMKDDPEIEAYIREVKRPDHANLIALARVYHDHVCRDEGCVMYEKKMGLPKVNAEFTYGMGYAPQVDLGLSMFGGTINAVSRRNEKFSFRTGVFYLVGENDSVEGFKIPFQVQYAPNLKWCEPRIYVGMYVYPPIMANVGLGFGHYPSLGLGVNVPVTHRLGMSIAGEMELDRILFGDPQIRPLSYFLNLGFYFRNYNNRGR